VSFRQLTISYISWLLCRTDAEFVAQKLQVFKCVIQWEAERDQAWAHCSFLRSGKSTRIAWWWLSVLCRRLKCRIQWWSLTMPRSPCISSSKTLMNACVWTTRLSMTFVSELSSSQPLLVRFKLPLPLKFVWHKSLLQV